MTERKLAKKMIIINSSRSSWQYRLRDLLILLVTWGGWLFLVLQPWLNYLKTGGKGNFIGSLDIVDAGQLFVVLLIGIFLLIHSWARYNKRLFLLARKRRARKK